MKQLKTTRKELNKAMSRADGWINILAGLGKKGVDKTEHTYFGERPVLDNGTLATLWMGDGLGKRIVSVVADDMTREGFTIAGDEKGKLIAEWDRLKATTVFTTALYWMRLFKGSIIVMGIDDGQELDKPVGASIRGIQWLKAYASDRVQITTTDIVADPQSPYFEEVEVFTIQKLDGTQLKVHASRCLIFKGDPVPQSAGMDFEILYWGMSALQPLWEDLKNFGSINKGLSTAMMELVIGKYKLSNLAQLLAENNTDAAYNRMQIINASKSIINAVLLGENEDYIRDTLNLSGASDVWDRFAMTLSGSSGIPLTRLLGRSPAGLNATGESDLQNYYDSVEAQQETKLLPPVKALISKMNLYIKASKDPQVTFNPVWTMSQKETIDARYKQAQTDQINIETGIVTSDEVRTSRFANGYSFETEIDAATIPEKPDPVK